MAPQPDSDVRTRILRAALDLIGREGLSAVSNRSIAGASGVSLGSLTYHFRTQQELVRESLELFLGEETARLRSLSDRLADASLAPAQAAAGLEAALQERSQARAAKLELYLQAAREPQLRDAAAACFAAYDELAAAALEAIGIAEPEHIAPLMVAVIDGLQLRHLALGGGRLDVARPLERLLGSLPREQP